MIKFILTLLLASIAMIGIVWFAVEQTWILHFPTFFYPILIFLFFSTAIMFAYLSRVKKPDSFIQMYLLFMVLKLLAYGAFVFILILMDAAGAVANAVFFMTTYFIFTALEVGFLFFRKDREIRP